MSIGENTVIFSITNGRGIYPQIAVLWAQFLDKLNINNYIIYCLDKKSFDYLDEKGVRCQLVKKKPQGKNKEFKAGKVGLDKAFGLMGAYKLMIAKDLLKKGKNIVFADTDAFFCRDPMPHIYELLDQYDCLWSAAVLGGSHPPKILKQEGLVACGGFFALKAGKGSIDFISNMERRRLGRLGGDFQRTVNFYMFPLIEKLGGGWDRHTKTRPLAHDIAFRVRGFHIKMLPQHIVMRGYRIARDSEWHLDVSHVPPYVFHCIGANRFCHASGVDLYKKLYG